jgi:hypothetical protein
VRGQSDPETLFRTIPGVGAELARRLVDQLHLSTLETLEATAYDGRLALAAGWGPRRVRMVQSVLGERLGRPRQRRPWPSHTRPPVFELLNVDREYRERAEAGQLRRIAPQRFNPTGDAWLPILHTERGPWRFTALSPLAHRLGRTDDWVVIFYETDDGAEGQCTVVTETRGARKGQRVVRGRELEQDGPTPTPSLAPGAGAARSA